jgi:hypothetical protein
MFPNVARVITGNTDEAVIAAAVLIEGFYLIPQSLGFFRPNHAEALKAGSWF